MPMPEASMDKDNGIVFWEADVGMPGELFGVEPISEAQCMKVLANDEFRLGVL